MKYFSLLSIALTVSAVKANEYVIQLKDASVASSFLNQDDEAVKAVQSQILHTVTIGDFHAIVAEVNSTSDIESLLSNEYVHEILPNHKFKALDSIQVQDNAPRHLASLSSDALLSGDGPFTYQYGGTGEGVYAYVIDSGIQIENPDYEGRAFRGVNYVTDEDETDQAGHGTHVSGILGSKTYGVAKDVTLIEVKVLDWFGTGSLSAILQGIEWAASNRTAKGVKGVANLSLGGTFSSILNDAANAAYASGLVVVAAAGNSNTNASLYSPASAEDVITVGNYDDSTGKIAGDSNYGAALDIFASGVKVVSLNYMTNDTTLTHSGTSMASPSVAGLAATLLDQGYTYDEIREQIISLSRSGLNITDAKYDLSPDRIAYNGYSWDDILVKRSEDVDTEFATDASSFDDLSDLLPTDEFDLWLLRRSAQSHGVAVEF